MYTPAYRAAEAVILAPLSGYTDLPFRMSCRRHGCRYAFTPLVDAGSIVYRDRRESDRLCRGADEPWLGTQVLGADPALLKAAAAYLNEHRFDVVDLNMGCPVPKVTKRGAGVALSHNRDLAAACAEALVTVCKAPVTAKIRALSPEDPASTVRLAVTLESCGISGLAIHGREWRQVYSGPVAVHVIKAVREALNIPVIANGGVFDRASGLALRQQTGCGLIMIARGAIGNPWIFREFADAGAPHPTHEEICDELDRHLHEMVAFHGETTGMRQARKIILAYLTGRGYKRRRRRAVTPIATVGEFESFLGIIRAEGPSPHFNPAHDGTHATGPQRTADAGNT